MEHQDWNSITFNTVSNNVKKETSKKKHSTKTSNPEDFKLEQSNNLGKIIAATRVAKNIKQKDLANKIGVSVQILNRWESNKEILTNANIATIEKILGVKLPRNKKVKVTENDT
tara:strand:+ start:5853 stop:6194 length:342 start_codon:yes stop_codon:yes gene_type:complete